MVVENFPKTDFPSDNFPSGNFPNVQFLKRQLPKDCLGSLRRCNGAKRCGYDGLGASDEDRMRWGESAATRTDLGSCRLGNCTFGKLTLGKIFWEST